MGPLRRPAGSPASGSRRDRSRWRSPRAPADLPSARPPSPARPPGPILGPPVPPPRRSTNRTWSSGSRRTSTRSPGQVSVDPMVGGPPVSQTRSCPPQRSVTTQGVEHGRRGRCRTPRRTSNGVPGRAPAATAAEAYPERVAGPVEGRGPPAVCTVASAAPRPLADLGQVGHGPGVRPSASGPGSLPSTPPPRPRHRGPRAPDPSRPAPADRPPRGSGPGTRPQRHPAPPRPPLPRRTQWWSQCRSRAKKPAAPPPPRPLPGP